MNHDPQTPTVSARVIFGLPWQEDAMIAIDHDLPLPALVFIRKAQDQLDRMRTHAVAVARVQGYTWQEIADGMGITRQAAQQGYGTK